MEINRVSYNHTLLIDKHYFSGYLNLAQNNIVLVLKAFSEHFSIKSKEIDYLKLFENQFLNDNISDFDFKNRIDFLKQHFPVLHYIDRPDVDRKEIRDNFKMLIIYVNNLRNFYSHYYHKPLDFDDDFFELLDRIFLSVVRDVKKNKMKDDKTRHLLNKNLDKELKVLVEEKRAQLKKSKAKGLEVSLKEEDVKNGVLNDAFYHLLYKKESVNKWYKSKYNSEKEAENKITISESGLLFLLGLFLSKKESEDLRSRIKGYKGKVLKDRDTNEEIDIGKNSLKFMATHWVFSHLSFKGVKKRLITDYGHETLLIQIIDELSKVPDEVYSTLEEKKQKGFIEDINEYIKEGKEIETLEESLIVHPVIRKRYENKFNYFVIRYLDEFAGFPNLRFQIHLGNYVHDRRLKNIGGTKFETERIIKERIKVFGRLSEVVNLKEDYNLKDSDKDESTGWEIFPNPSYNFVANNIPVFINLRGSKVDGAMKLFGKIEKNKATFRKDEKRTEGKATKEVITDMIYKGKEREKSKPFFIEEPTALLSLNELPALLYELLKKGKSAEEVENKMVEKLIERFNTIKEYIYEDNLSTSQITKNLRKSSNVKQINTQKLIAAIKREINVSCEKLEMIDRNRKDLEIKKNNKFLRKYIFTTKELGQEATWLANDLKRFMPIEARENWKGYQHSQLQQSLAFFDRKPNEAFSLLSQVWSFDDEKYIWNNWIKNSLKEYRTFDRMYQYYLQKRKEYYSTLSEGISIYIKNKKLLRKFLSQQNIWTIFIKRLYKIDTTEQQIKKLLDKPLVFPRGIFDPKPTYIQGVKIADNKELFADWYQYSYLPDHQFQQFYEYRRDYKELFKEEKEKNEQFQNNKKQLTYEEQFNLFKLKQDLQIKKNKTQDLFLKLIAEDLFQKVFQYDVELPLSDLYLTQEERIEKERVALAQSQRQEGDCTENIIKDNFIWNKPVPYKSKYINEPNVKLKDIGKFKRFLLDEKVETLLSYDLKTTWTKQELEDELTIKKESYETIRREELLKVIQELEKDILFKHDFNGVNHPLELEQGSNPNFKHYIVNGILSKYQLADENEINWLLSLKTENFDNETEELTTKLEKTQKAFLLILIRNKFAHNQLPHAIYFNLIKESVNTTQDVTNMTASEIILSYAREVIKEFKRVLKVQENQGFL